MQVVACCSCRKAPSGKRKLISRGLIRLQAEPETKEVNVGSAASAQNEGDEMELVRPIASQEILRCLTNLSVGNLKPCCGCMLSLLAGDESGQCHMPACSRCFAVITCLEPVQPACCTGTAFAYCNDWFDAKNPLDGSACAKRA